MWTNSDVDQQGGAWQCAGVNGRVEIPGDEHRDQHQNDPGISPADAASGVPLMPDPRMLATTDDVNLATYQYGTGQDYLLAHCTGMCAAAWSPLLEDLGAGDRISAVSVDHRGHGRSNASITSMAWEAHAADLLATVDSYDMAKPIGIGHSMGGAALLLAEQARPGTFAALWIYEPIVLPPTARSGGNSLADGARRRRETFASESAAYEVFSSKPPLNELSTAALLAYVRYGFRELPDGSITLRCKRDVEANTYAMGTSHGAWARLGEIGCPVVIAYGEETTPGPAAIAPLIAERIPNGRSHKIDGLGHFGPMQDPERIAAEITEAFD